jgi:hypothetical protein
VVSFYGPGMDNWDIVLHKLTRLAEGKTLEFRFETFNAFNHAQFFGSGSVDGNVASSMQVRLAADRQALTLNRIRRAFTFRQL